MIIALKCLCWRASKEKNAFTVGAGGVYNAVVQTSKGNYWETSKGRGSDELLETNPF